MSEQLEPRRPQSGKPYRPSDRRSETRSEEPSAQSRHRKQQWGPAAFEPAGLPGTGEGRRRSELAAQQRLMADEMERRVHALQLEWKQERKRMRQEIETLQKELEAFRLAHGEF